MSDTSNTGFCVPFEVRQTNDKGLGVFACASISKGDIVWRHVTGQYKVFDEPGFRAAIQAMSNDEVVYELTHIFGLVDFPGCLIRIYDAGGLINFDRPANLATNFGAEPAIPVDLTAVDYTQKVTELLLQDRYALVATRDIADGEEFTNDYEAEIVDPPFYEELCDQYAVNEDYLDGL